MILPPYGLPSWHGHGQYPEPCGPRLRGRWQGGARSCYGIGMPAFGAMLETLHFTKEFNGFVAVDNVSLKIRQGSIHGLIGPNGAGKTTVFNLLSKFTRPTRGRILYQGSGLTHLAPAEVARRGIVRSFQISAVFPHLTARENVRVALQRKLGTSLHFWRSERSLEALDAQAQALLERVGLLDQAAALAVELPYGGPRALEIATPLPLEPELMLLDEPTQGLGHDDG